MMKSARETSAAEHPSRRIPWLASIARRALPPAFGLVLSCGAGGRAVEPTRTLMSCVPESLRSVLHADVELAPEILEARNQGTFRSTLESGEALWEELVTEAAAVLHSPQAEGADDARAFLARWVYREPPLVVVDIDAFRLVPSAGAVLVHAAAELGDAGAMRRWLDRTVVDLQARDAALACIDAVSRRERVETAASP